MPRPGEYTPARRNIMQGVMWGILALTIVMAALVTRSQRQAARVELNPSSITAGNVTVRLPAKWRARPRGDVDPRVIAQAAEAAPGEGGRTIQILNDHLDEPMSPLQYVCRNFGVSVPGLGGDDFIDSIVSATQVGGYPGIIVTVHRARSRRRGPDLRKDLYACAVLPSLQVLTVHLSGEEAADITDQAVVTDIASSITVNAPAKLEPDSASITLADGITLSPPSGFAALAQSDPNRSDRRLWPKREGAKVGRADQLEQEFVSIEVVGCLFPHLELSDPRRDERARTAMITMLLLRDQLWRDAKVIEEQNIWRADLPQVHEEDRFPARAYLVPDRSGRALLVVMSGGFNGGGPAFDRAWKELSPTVKFLRAADTSQLEDAGAAEASRLLRAGELDKLLGDRDEQWWLWTDATDRPHVGWSHLRWEPEAIEAVAETRLKLASGDIERVQARWTLKPDASQYHCDVTRTDSAGEEDRMLRQTTTLRNRQISMSVQSQSSSVAQWKSAAPAQFVPGQLLFALMGKLAPGPMLLRTESFLGAEAVGPLEPLGVVIRPAESSTRTTEGDAEPLRCVTSQVNGSGRIIRWYFRSTGELDAIELRGGVQCNATELDDIRINFSRDKLMVP